jgi:beta-galactosidase
MPKSKAKPAHTFVQRDGRFLIDGRPFVVRCGELHYPRIPRAYWRHRLEAARAMGLNTVCLYLFWNYHETVPGRFDFAGERDVSAFCDLAAELGLWVVLRPGPYSCAEWDFGGLPAYLLADPRMRLRCSYPGFLRPALRWLGRVGRELARHQITRSGPILMVQVENEYGVYGNDHAYLRALRDALRAGGFDVPLVRCDWAHPAQMVPGHFDDAVPMVANFGSRAEENIRALAATYPEAPRMCGEFWMGWFDWWGHPRNGADTEDGEKHRDDLRWMLEQGVSFSLYMFHGGTSFGFAPGANCQNGRYDPYVTSYDYFAPLDEQGRARPKYFIFRELIAGATGESFPPPPAPVPVAPLPRFALARQAPLLPGRGTRGARHLTPPTMEELGQAHGCVLYRTDLAGRVAGRADLRVREVHDHAWVFLNGALVGTLDRQAGRMSLPLEVPERGPALLEILVEAHGHVNFGPAMNEDRKGITSRVELGWITLFDWEVFPLPLAKGQLAGLRWSAKPIAAGRPAFHRGVFVCADGHPADTHLDLRGWGKGHVWVNGRHLGRFWRIGPQRTLYLPGCWLRRGRNEVAVLEFENTAGAGPRTLAGLAEPILDDVSAVAQKAG